MEVGLRADMISLLTPEEQLTELINELKMCGTYPGYYLTLVKILELKNNVIDEEFCTLFWTQGKGWEKSFLKKLVRQFPKFELQSQTLNKYIEELSVKIF